MFVCDNYHGKGGTLTELNKHPLARDLYLKGPVHIGKNVLIGRNTCILANVNIGDGAIIGANSVVTHDVESNTVVVGAPAKIIKKIK